VTPAVNGGGRQTMKRPVNKGLFAFLCVAALVNPGNAQTASPALNTLKEVGDTLSACWLPPPMEEGRPGMEITAVFSFNRSGEILGEPRFTYLTPGVSTAVRAAYQRAVAATLKRCTPLKFTPELAGALAGRPFAMRFIDNRTPPGRRA
jgi:hypothetical protein